MNFKWILLVFIIISISCNAKHLCSEQIFTTYISALKLLNIPTAIQKNIILDYLYDCRNKPFVKALSQDQSSLQSLFYDSSETSDQFCTFEEFISILSKLKKFDAPRSLRRDIYKSYWEMCPKYLCSDEFLEKIVRLFSKSTVPKRKQMRILKSFVNKCAQEGED